MSKYAIYKNQSLLDNGNAAAHAIVIGTGHYPHLMGGGGDKTDFHGGLGQLSSPPQSAKEFTDWLLSHFNNSAKPLATISLLVSEKNGPFSYQHEKLPESVTVEQATIDNIEEAIWAWKDYGDSHEENLMLFFFCGHGVARGMDSLTLLLSDYGKNNNRPMKGALDFTAFQRGMAQCKASEQCFFIDACRSVSNIATKTTEKGNSIIQDNQNRSYQSDWSFAVFYSTLGGEKAYGRKNKASFYTEELLKGLNGTGSNNRNGDGEWRVSTGDLNTAIHRGLSAYGDKIKNPMTMLVQFEFHELLHDPIVPVTVYCDPRSNNQLATFSCHQNGNPVQTREPGDQDWLVDLQYGRYDFMAEIETRTGEKNDQSVIPPYREIKIEVAS